MFCACFFTHTVYQVDSMSDISSSLEFQTINTADMPASDTACVFINSSSTPVTLKHTVGLSRYCLRLSCCRGFTLTDLTFSSNEPSARSLLFQPIEEWDFSSLSLFLNDMVIILVTQSPQIRLISLFRQHSGVPLDHGNYRTGSNASSQFLILSETTITFPVPWAL